ncbi:MAG TPA: formate dehydrogenase accessory sulfurtransferase FdhD [Vicinamibacterales bacterium]|nr:formate dehydrogenase accessory sulfurtransferase FdhD [Vicinamibacterales bacterium]
MTPPIFDDESGPRDSSRIDRPYWLATAKLARHVRVVHVSPGARTTRRDMTATEEPLQIRVCGNPFAVLMRTPGSDRELAAGFLLAERVVHEAGDVGTVAMDPEAQNTLDVTLGRRRAAELPRLLEARRQVVGSSACGLCGRRTIESLRAEAPNISAAWTISPELMPRLPERLRGSQQVFDATGGLHAAGLFDRTGRLTAYAEDVGRHNAVDKVFGRMLLSGRLPLDHSILFVSGRTSFEIVQKALLAGVPIVGSVSAPSSLAVELAEEVGITLLGFVRGEAFNVYAHHWRLVD